MRREIIAAAIWTLSFIAGPGAHGATKFVKAGAGGTCASWSDACSLDQAVTSAGVGDEVWVQAGTYGPVRLENGVKVIGGFAGTETSASQSDPWTRLTVIDGGLGGRAVSSENNASSTVLRGFTIRNGYDGSNDGGGGILVQDSSALFVECIISGNRASMFGAGAAVRGASSPQFINCIFRDNGSDAGTPENTDDSPMGGGVVFIHRGSATFTNCLFHDNVAGEGGALVIMAGAATFVNCTLADNEATVGSGGALFDQEGLVTLRNSIVWHNASLREGPEIFNARGFSTAVTYGEVQGGWTGTGNIAGDPLFVDPSSGDYKLQTASPCRNVGENKALPSDVADLDGDGTTNEQIPWDLFRNPRRRQMTVDMGVYESPFDSQ